MIERRTESGSPFAAASVSADSAPPKKQVVERSEINNLEDKLLFSILKCAVTCRLSTLHDAKSRPVQALFASSKGLLNYS